MSQIKNYVYSLFKYIFKLEEVRTTTSNSCTYHKTYCLVLQGMKREPKLKKKNFQGRTLPNFLYTFTNNQNQNPKYIRASI